jgi:alpha-aminoadipic semialdehyde synthase
MAALIRSHQLQFVVQPSSIRIFPDNEFRQAGARVDERLDRCGVVLAVKEIPQQLFRKGVTYVFFSHTIKGQPYNMDMLRRLIELKCNLIDYERILNDAGQRLIFFGRHAGMAGMIDTLWGLGQRLRHENVTPNPLCDVKLAHQYADLNAAIDHLRQISGHIRREGFADPLAPLFIGVAGYGNVSAGAQEILDCLPVEPLEPEALAIFYAHQLFDRNKIYKVVFREEHMVTPTSTDEDFDLNEYYTRPERYRSVFDAYLPYLTVLMNCIYWDTPYPRLITKASLKTLYAAGGWVRLKAIGDISCDIEGAIEFTAKVTEPDNPVYVYEPESGQILDGVQGNGPLIMAVDNLPCEFPRESSADFSHALAPFLPALAAADYTLPFEQLNLPSAIKDALLIYQGNFTPDYQFMEAFLK